MARKPTGNPADLEREIGARGSVEITAANRGLVRRWMRARGIPSAIVEGLPVSVLSKAYNDETAFAAMVEKIDETLQEAIQQEAQPDMNARPQFAPDANTNRAKPNKWAGVCCICDTPVAPQAGAVWRPSEDADWRVYCSQHAPKVESEPASQISGTRPTMTIIDEIAGEDAEEIRQVTAGAADHDDAARKLQDAIRLIAEAATPKNVPLDEKRVIELIKQHGAEPATVRLEIKRGDQTTFTSDAPRHYVFERVLRHVAAGCHVYLVGPAGSGKSTIAEQVAEALDLRFHATNAVRSPFALTGYKDAAGNYHRTEFREAYENGGLFLFDEIDASAADALVTFNGAMAQNQFAFPDGMVDRHEAFHVIAAANTIGRGADRQYVGRNQLDAATLDRFSFIEMGYDERLERTIAGDDGWCDWVQAIRAAVDELKIRLIVSPRASIMGARLLAAGEETDAVEHATIFKGIDDATRQKVLSRAIEIRAERRRQRERQKGAA